MGIRRVPHFLILGVDRHEKARGAMAAFRTSPNEKTPSTSGFPQVSEGCEIAQVARLSWGYLGQKCVD